MGRLNWKGWGGVLDFILFGNALEALRIKGVGGSFTFRWTIDLMFSILIIAILCTLAIPQFIEYKKKAILIHCFGNKYMMDQVHVYHSVTGQWPSDLDQLEEAFNLAEMAKAGICEYYRATKKMPKDNREAGLPVPDKIIGNYVTHVKVHNGVIEISLGNRINQNVLGKVVTVRPAIVKDDPTVPIAWVYAFASVPQGTTVLGQNTSTVDPRHLPVNCRY
ncbi:MAG: pilin [Proteobacteria bacterium]|nr:pilin [Pseudomonadota bacterium]